MQFFQIFPNFSKFFQIFPNFSKFFQIFLLLVIGSGFLRAQNTCGGTVMLEQDPYDAATQTIKVKLMAKYTSSTGSGSSASFSNFNSYVELNGMLGPLGGIMTMTSSSTNVTLSTSIPALTFTCSEKGVTLASTFQEVGCVILSVSDEDCGSQFVFDIVSCTALNGSQFCDFENLTTLGNGLAGLTVYAPKCPDPTIGGQVKKPVASCPQVGGSFLAGIKDVDIEITKAGIPQCFTPIKTGAAGYYSSCALDANNTYSVKASKACAKPKLGCITTYDIVIAQKTILFDPTAATEPWQFIAADANGNGSITTLDLIEIRKYLLGVTTSLPGGCYRFIPESNMGQIVLSPSAQLSTLYDMNLNVNYSNIIDANFIGIVKGDMNGSCYCGEILNLEVPSKGTEVQRDIVENTTNSRELAVDYTFTELNNLELIQFEIEVPKGFDLSSIESNLPNFSDNDFAFDEEKRLIKIIWLNLTHEKMEGKPYIRLHGNRVSDFEISKELFNVNRTASVLNTSGTEYSMNLKQAAASDRSAINETITNSEILVYDYMGRVVSVKNSLDKNYLLELQNELENGLYIIVGKGSVKKIVVNR